ncbi:lycopene beta-cyclase CrtY [Peredibacter starrii]|uniref:Lycopene beta-cyclase CrtY n=1 Tax=Peredibacter starrii TaxID=28202 RepID=A0AAX4HPV2_9BACT|nr:lycopene beta-cyclase CrtY [Peredibacter starrii]WPU65133.1 lycopene beta-cyclase CrtY [Peredibacter starrii]
MDRPIVILGGGLWGGLLGYRLSLVHPDKKFLVLEADSRFGGNHTWSFHSSDVDISQLKWLAPIIRQSWTGYTVHFPDHSRHIKGSYHSICSDKFHEVLNERLKQNTNFNKYYSLEEAKKLGSFVIDARGKFEEGRAGYQKFLGLEVELEESHNLIFPILMDAKVSQSDGYRFLYYLPFSSNTVLVEDTRYSSRPDLNEAELENEIFYEIRRRGWKIKSVIRKEKGVLPIPLSKLNHQEKEGVVDLGGILHDTTGYSLPDAIRLVDLLMKTDLSLNAVKSCVKKYREDREKDRSFFRILNLLMFEAAKDNERYRVFQHFYLLPEPTIARFYQGKLTRLDRAKIFIGKPPVPVLSAIKCFLPQNKRVNA